MQITVEIADVIYRIEFKDPAVFDRLKDYRSNAAADHLILTDDTDIAEYLDRQKRRLSGMKVRTEENPEAGLIYDKLASALPLHQAILLHGAAIVFDQKAFVFTGPSGIGKSTQAGLWKKVFGERVQILNGDRTVIRKGSGSDTGFLVCGFPWGGKENWQMRMKAPLSAVILLDQASDNRAFELSKEKAWEASVRQAFIPLEDTGISGMALDLIRNICENVPFFKLDCTPDERAVHCCYTLLAERGFLETGS